MPYPANSIVFFSNGMAVRYAGLSLAPMPHACWCNRGVSGIEGGNATAVGTAVCYAGPTMLVTGDMSFSYAPEIMGLDIVPDDFKIVVLNNGGGGIFRCIRATSGLPIREEMLCATRQLPLGGLCRAYGWNYLHADSETALNAGPPRLCSAPDVICSRFRSTPPSLPPYSRDCSNSHLSQRR